MKRWVAAAFLAGVLASGLQAERFEHKFRAGERYRFLSTAEEDVYYNRTFSHHAEIVNRISFEVPEAFEDGSGLLRGEFTMATRVKGLEAFVEDRRYESEYRLSRDGRYDIDDRFYMPVVRNVPTFPDRDLAPGDTWAAPGEEKHDFREDFGIPDPFVIPFTASYTYVGPETRDGIDVRVIKAAYTIFHRPPEPLIHSGIFPTQIAGWSEQTLYWDPLRGGLHSYEERFQFVLELSNGTTVEFRGKAASRMLEAPALDREALARELQEATKDLENVTIQTGDEGVTITIEDVQFEADSARLLPSEVEKIGRIAEILKSYPERDILVEGHTALAGTAAGRQQLSVERAAVVADRLVRLGVRTPDRIVVRGWGAERPIDTNSTEAGRSRNRRVEITILEN